jgi:RNA polymerase sigma-70 factor, ECF subfamily
MDRKAEALERLYRDRYARFRDGLAPITGSYDTAHDAVQEAFAKAFASRRGFRGDGSLEGWVWRIAFRIALRHRGREHELVDGRGAMVVMPERDPELAEVLRSLPPQRRLIVFLHYFADLPYAEIARLCSISEGTVGASLSQARAALRATLEREEVPS